MKRTDVFNFIISSTELDDFRENDACLEEIISMAKKEPEIWRTHGSISITSPPPIAAGQIEEIYTRRLSYIPSTGNAHDTLSSTKMLVAYCRNKPTASIWVVIFNCQDRSYSVFCGQDNDQLEVINVIVSGYQSDTSV